MEQAWRPDSGFSPAARGVGEVTGLLGNSDEITHLSLLGRFRDETDQEVDFINREDVVWGGMGGH